MNEITRNIFGWLFVAAAVAVLIFNRTHDSTSVFFESAFLFMVASVMFWDEDKKKGGEE